MSLKKVRRAAVEQERHPCRCDASRMVCARNCASAPIRPGERRECLRVSKKKRRTLRSAQRGTECDPRKSRSFSQAPDRHPEGQDYRLGSRERRERVAARQRHTARLLVVSPIRPAIARRDDPAPPWFQPSEGHACKARYRTSCCGYAPSDGKSRGAKHSQCNDGERG